MPPGKAAAQAGHAFLGAISVAAATPFAADVEAYLRETPGTKVVLGASLEELERLAARLGGSGVPAFLTIDRGHVMPPHFDGTPIVTALGIGPLRRDLSRRYLRHLRIYRG